MIFNTFAILGAAALAQALPQQRSQSRDASECTNPSLRVEWRDLTGAQQKEYIDAVLCLKTKPSRIGLSTLYDDFPHIHFELARSIHNSAPFLPWHRYFGTVYLKAIQECGYTGPGTYWDWTLDHESLLNSPVMSAETGFGGTGSENRTETVAATGDVLQCVDNGPFKDLRPEYLANAPDDISSGGHCLFRQVAEVSQPSGWDIMKVNLNPTYVAEVQSIQEWTTYAQSIEASPHGTIHASLSGEMNPSTSPNEPLFFLHHAQIDRLWWLWQQEQPSSRTSEYSGSYLPFGTTEYVPASPNDTLHMLGLDDDVLVKDVLDTTNGRLCYRY